MDNNNFCKKKKNGFTLVELIAVVAILITILLVAIPTISSTLNKNDADNLEKKKNLIISALEIYLNDNKDLYKSFVKGDCYVSTSILKNTDYISQNNLYDDNNNLINLFVFYKNNSYVYEDSDNGLPQCQVDKSNNSFVWGIDSTSKKEYISSQGGIETGNLHIEENDNATLYYTMSFKFIDKFNNVVDSEYQINNASLKIYKNEEILYTILGNDLLLDTNYKLTFSNLKNMSLGGIDIVIGQSEDSTLFKYVFEFPPNNTNKCVYMELNAVITALQAEAPDLSKFNTQNQIPSFLNDNQNISTKPEFIYFSDSAYLQPIIFVIPPINGSNSC